MSNDSILQVETAPIVLFVYNRPAHTRRTLEALCRNHLADRSVLYVYCDGAKPGASGSDLEQIATVRQSVRECGWPGALKIIERDANSGLAHSVITGVTEVIGRHGKVIVLEDDLVTSPSFLEYMNYGLHRFAGHGEVGSINASWLHERIAPLLPGYFFLNSCDCWGWATWKDRWELFETDGKKLLEALHGDEVALKRFEPEWMDILEAQIAGKVSSWHVRWLATCILHRKIGLFSRQSYLANIGLDDSGTHRHTAAQKEMKRLRQDVDYHYLDAMKTRHNPYAERMVSLSRATQRLGSRIKDKFSI